jgi:transcriptional regulator with XRE-family HTH domain
MARARRGSLKREGYEPRTIERRDPRYVTIGRRLEFLRRVVNNESIEELAKHVDASPSAIRQWDIGQTVPSVENMERIANHYQVSLDYLRCLEFLGLSEAQLRALPEEIVLRRPGMESKRFLYTAVEVAPLLR